MPEKYLASKKSNPVSASRSLAVNSRFQRFPNRLSVTKQLGMNRLPDFKSDACPGREFLRAKLVQRFAHCVLDDVKFMLGDFDSGMSLFRETIKFLEQLAHLLLGTSQSPIKMRQAEPIAHFPHCGPYHPNLVRG
jgi:hypothetical protein